MDANKRHQMTFVDEIEDVFFISLLTYDWSDPFWLRQGLKESLCLTVFLSSINLSTSRLSCLTLLRRTDGAQNTSSCFGFTPSPGEFCCEVFRVVRARDNWAHRAQLWLVRTWPRTLVKTLNSFTTNLSLADQNCIQIQSGAGHGSALDKCNKETLV